MKTLDWSQFEERIPIKASNKQIIDAWSTAEAIETWFLSNADYFDKEGQKIGKDQTIQAGYTYNWSWYGYPDYVDSGKIISFDENKITFSFGEEFTVSVSCIIEQDETLLVLHQSGMQTDDQNKMNFYLGCTKGWTFYMTNLKSILEGGIDLRNKNDELKRVINS